MSGSDTMAESPRATLRVPEVGRELGIAPRTVWRLISMGELKVVRCGRAVRVPRASLEEFIARGGTRR